MAGVLGGALTVIGEELCCGVSDMAGGLPEPGQRLLRGPC